MSTGSNELFSIILHLSWKISGTKNMRGHMLNMVFKILLREEYAALVTEELWPFVYFHEFFFFLIFNECIVIYLYSNM